MRFKHAATSILLFTLVTHKQAQAQAVFPFQSTPNITPSPNVFSKPSLENNPVSPPPPQSEIPSIDDSTNTKEIIHSLKKVIVAFTSKNQDLSHPLPGTELDMTSAVKPFIGRPLTAQTLDLIIKRVNAACRTLDKPFVYAYIPPQKIVDGELHVLLRQYEIGNITITGNRWFSKDLIRYESGLRSGATPSLSALQSDVDWLNRSPFRSSEIIFSPGQETGKTNADIYVSDRLPLYFFSSVNNQNDPTIGRTGWAVGGSWGNAFNLDQIITYQYSRTTTDRNFNHAAAWQIPITSRNSIIIFGNYAKSHPIAPPGVDYQNYGGGASVSFRWQHMLQHWAIGSHFGLDGNIQLGYDWKNANSYQKKGEYALTIGNADTNQFLFIYSGSLQDPFGKTEFSNQMVYGPGGMTRRNNRAAYQTISLGASPNYFYDRLTLSRSIDLWWKTKLNLKVIHQSANKNLLYSEQQMLGGIGSVRGYYISTSFGSHANVFNAEWATSTFSIGHALNWKYLHDETSVAFFWDYGNNRQIKQVVQGIHSVTLSSIGLTTTSKLTHHLNSTLDVGWRLRRARSIGSKGAVVEYNLVAGF
ncbi:ShlB/FhaC/HecB family hemolysin secretion/activation protein [Swingsia samuiensis]|uniref:ShlB/FhaC/HecB family hemolysin secretion/activation protein n=1 Tax=Swingsia samuiensis TaxID=1293412 RepID=A0A4Y6UJN8_9PROT|nr:ShlB/FhaC/HecB family hemolysin secretion/activation protein [Swingsia samuiensis]QDH16686.1 ShlB/FhaC/HecB family hemolysin secretion/activation protein [Swingsia samuiensis]